LLGNFQLRDPESGSGVGAVLSREDLAHYRDVFDEYCAGMRRLCRRASVGLLQTSSASRPAEAIARLTRLHQSFRRGGA
jgi:hypothetical protein